MRALIEGGEVVPRLAERVLGRTAAEDMNDPATGKVIVKAGELIEEEQVEIIETAGMQEIRIRSALTCETRIGICAQVLRARSRPRHAGQHRRGGRRHRRAVDRRAGHAAHHADLPYRRRGAGGRRQSFLEANYDGKVKISSRNVVKNSQGVPHGDGPQHARSFIVDEDGSERAVHQLPYGTHLRVDEGAKVKRGDRLAEWDPYTLSDADRNRGHSRLRGPGRGRVGQRGEGRSRPASPTRHRRLAGEPAGVDLRPAVVIKDKKGKIAKLSRRRRGALPAAGGRDPSVEPGHEVRRRRARAYPDGKRQDPRHHRRSAAGGRAVRGEAAEGSRDHRRDVGHGGVRQATTRTSGASLSRRTTRAASRSSI